MEGHKIHLNQQTRTLKLRTKDVLAAQALLPNGKSLLQALAVDCDAMAVCIGAAMAMRHEYKDPKKAPSPSMIADWIDREPKKFRELEMAVFRAAEDHYVAIDRLERGDLTGEVPPATTPSSPDGSTSSALPGDGVSTPISSDD